MRFSLSSRVSTGDKNGGWPGYSSENFLNIPGWNFWLTHWKEIKEVVSGLTTFPEIPDTLRNVRKQDKGYPLVGPGAQTAVRTYILYQTAKPSVSHLQPFFNNSRFGSLIIKKGIKWSGNPGNLGTIIWGHHTHFSILSALSAKYLIFWHGLCYKLYVISLI